MDISNELRSEQKLLLEAAPVSHLQLEGAQVSDIQGLTAGRRYSHLWLYTMQLVLKLVVVSSKPNMANCSLATCRTLPAHTTNLACGEAPHTTYLNYRWVILCLWQNASYIVAFSTFCLILA